MGAEMKKPECPCRECDRHSAECHAGCERYEAWTAEWKDYKKVVQEAKHPEIRDYIWERAAK